MVEAVLGECRSHVPLILEPTGEGIVRCVHGGHLIKWERTTEGAGSWG